MFGVVAYVACAIAAAENAAVERARRTMTPEDFKAWQAERVRAAEHRALCRAIEQAGENARPRGIGIFW